MASDAVKIEQALSAVMADVREVKKTGRNEAQKYDFRGVDAVVNAVGPALRAHEVLVLPHVDHIEYEKVPSSSGKNMMSVRVIVTYTFVGPMGDSLAATVAGEAFDSGDKATAKAMSVAFRIALLQALALPTDDIDPDAQTYEMAGESTVASRDSVTSPSEPRDAPAANNSGRLAPNAGTAPSAASPTPSAGLGGSADPVEAGDSKVTTAIGQGAATSGETPTSTNYLSKDDQSLLGVQYGSKALAVKAYRARFGDRIRSISDVTYEMRDALEAANA